MNGKDIVQLSQADQQAVDQLIEAGLDLSKVPAEHRARAGAALEVMRLLDHLPEQSAGDLLVARTLEQIHRSQQHRRFEQQARSLSRRPGDHRWRITTRDWLAVAAMMLIGLSIFWPMLNPAPQANPTAVHSNLAAAGMGAAAYSDPRAGNAIRLGDPWWLTDRFDGQPTSGAGNMQVFVLTPQGYVSIGELRGEAALPTTPGLRDLPTAMAHSFAAASNPAGRRVRITLNPQAIQLPAGTLSGQSRELPIFGRASLAAWHSTSILDDALGFQDDNASDASFDIHDGPPVAPNMP
jgi:hypothetical protein